MIRAILFDLDSTLLRHPQGDLAFARMYLQGLNAFFTQKLNLPAPAEALMQVAGQLHHNVDPLITNQELYLNALKKMLNADSSVQVPEMMMGFDRFYREAHPPLQSRTCPVTGTAELITWLLEHDYAVAIATNPHYPFVAVEQRLQWAGLDPKKWPFAYISHSENSHFVKPCPHYYEEVMAHVGFEPYETLMVGDDWQRDIMAASQTGMQTFWINSAEQKSRSPDLQPAIPPLGEGSFADFAQRVMQEDLLCAGDCTIEDAVILREHIVPRMLGNVGTLMSMVSAVLPHHWWQRPDPDEWSPLEIVVHLRESEHMVQRPRLEKIAAEDNPFLRAPRTPPGPGSRDIQLKGLNGKRVAISFAEERQKTIAFLESLAPEAWQRPARHSILGPTNLLEMAAFTTRHDHLHITQLCQTLGKCE